MSRNGWFKILQRLAVVRLYFMGTTVSSRLSPQILLLKNVPFNAKFFP